MFLGILIFGVFWLILSIYVDPDGCGIFVWTCVAMWALKTFYAFPTFLWGCGGI